MKSEYFEWATNYTTDCKRFVTIIIVLKQIGHFLSQCEETDNSYNKCNILERFDTTKEMTPLYAIYQDFIGILLSGIKRRHAANGALISTQ